jgi:hypothetical protein
MPRITWRPLLTALALSGPVVVLVMVGRLAHSEAIGHVGAFVAVTLGLPWVVPAFVVVAVLSAPLYIALHIVGQPQPLAPWLSGVILIGGIVACHVNATLLISSLLRKRPRTRDAGLADFLFRSPAHIG